MISHPISQTVALSSCRHFVAHVPFRRLSIRKGVTFQFESLGKRVPPQHWQDHKTVGENGMFTVYTDTLHDTFLPWNNEPVLSQSSFGNQSDGPFKGSDCSLDTSVLSKQKTGCTMVYRPLFWIHVKVSWRVDTKTNSMVSSRWNTGNSAKWPGTVSPIPGNDQKFGDFGSNFLGQAAMKKYVPHAATFLQVNQTRVPL